MRTMKHVALAAMAAAGLALAACGGGGSKKPAVMGDQQMEMTPVEKAQSYVAAATAAKKAAEDAVKTAKMQLDAAKLANAYDIYTTGGESSVVRTNAAAVMAAKAAADKALADAKAALTAARKAQTDLNAVPAGTPGLASQKEVVGQRIKDVEAQIKLIEGYQTTVNGYAAKVDTEAKIKGLAGETPASAAMSGNNARRVLYMLQPYGGDGGNEGHAKVETRLLRRPLLDAILLTEPVAPDPSDDTTATDTGRSKAYVEYDLRGLPGDAMTWEQIAGAGNLVKKAFGNNIMDVDVLPLAGMPLSVLTGSDGTALTTFPPIPATGILADQYYKGIKGTLYCQGSCKVDGGNLMGSLYFQKAGENIAGSTRYYQMKAGNTYYTPYGVYARYGYGLYETGSTTGITLFAHSPAGSDGDVSETAGLAKTATYEGKALGLSVLKTYTGPTVTGLKSGQFTADVTLNAKFGAAGTPALGGKIDNFMGNAVDEDWSVTLTEKKNDNLEIVGSPGSRGVAQGSDSVGGEVPQAGEWQAKPYGDSDTKRPVGVIGDFNAHFSNGHAAGAFATRMKTETAE